MKKKLILTLLLSLGLYVSYASADTVADTKNNIHPIQQITSNTTTSSMLNIDGNFKLLSDSSKHIKYMSIKADGMFHPNDAIKKGELANILYKFMDKSNVDNSKKNNFADLAQTAWNYDVFNTLVNAGLLKVDANNKINPNSDITKEEFANMVAPFIQNVEKDVKISDVNTNSKSYDNIKKLVSSNLLTVDKNGKFEPTKTVPRVRTAIIFNTLLGRTDTKTGILSSDANIPVIIDVPKTNWAYSHIIEAVTGYNVSEENGQKKYTNISFDKLSIKDGYVTSEGNLYYVQKGEVVKNKVVNNMQFDENGKYTTKNEELDKKLVEIVKQYTKDTMTQEEKLKALYNYVINNYTYIKRSLIQVGERGWSEERALKMINDKKGNCYSYAALFYHLSKQVGADSQIVLGKVARVHGWVEVKLDSKPFIYDTELGSVHRNYNFCKITYSPFYGLPYQVYEKQGN